MEHQPSIEIDAHERASKGLDDANSGVDIIRYSLGMLQNTLKDFVDVDPLNIEFRKLYETL